MKIASKKIPCGAILTLFLITNSCTANMPDPRVPYYIAPQFTFKCFADKLFSVPRLCSIAAAGLGFWCLKRCIENLIERNNLVLPEGRPITREMRLKKARDYGIAAVCLIGSGALLYRRAARCH